MARINLTVLTWNIWFGRLRFNDRCKSILQFTEDNAPDVVCFQEATPRFIEHLNETNLLNIYDWSDDGSGSSLGHYGVLMLCKKELNATFTTVEFDTNMGRKLLYTSFNINGENIAVGTVHLESLNNHSFRVKQLQVCNTQLSSFANAILCGDFNFCSYRNFNPDPSKPLENDCLEEVCPDWSDMWLKLVVDPYLNQLQSVGLDPESVIDQLPENVIGYTFDSVVNPNIDHFERFRIDRMMYKLTESGTGTVLRPEGIEVIGKIPINEEELAQLEASLNTQSAFSTPPRARSDSMHVPVYPSDHFGLMATFAIV